MLKLQLLPQTLLSSACILSVNPKRQWQVHNTYWLKLKYCNVPMVFTDGQGSFAVTRIPAMDRFPPCLQSSRRALSHYLFIGRVLWIRLSFSVGLHCGESRLCIGLGWDPDSNVGEYSWNTASLLCKLPQPAHPHAMLPPGFTWLIVNTCLSRRCCWKQLIGMLLLRVRFTMHDRDIH